MARKLILDVDPGIDDAIAMGIALFDPEAEVVAITAVGGNVPPPQATRNVHTIIEQLDPPRWPRVGTASPPDQGLPVDGRHLFGLDGLGGADFQVAELRTPHPSEKILCDEIRAAPEAVTVVALGPLTNIARAFIRDPELPSLVGHLVIVGGAVASPGNITPTAEFNIYCDPASARAVFRSPCTKTLVPLDVTNRVELSFDLLRQLPDESTRVGRFLHKIIPPVFRAYRQRFGLEGIHIHDTVGLLAALQPDLFTTQEMAGDVELMGELTCGATIFDRRRRPDWRRNMAVVVDMQVDAIVEQFVARLSAAAAR